MDCYKIRRIGLLDGTKKWITRWYEEMEAYMVRRNGLLDGSLYAYGIPSLYGTNKWIARRYEEMDY